MGHVIARLGEAVPRTELERDVRAFAAGVRSEAVPMALRGLCAKLGPHADRLQTLGGVG